MGKRISEEELYQVNQFTIQELHYIHALVKTLDGYGVPEDCYCVNGYGDSCVCLHRTDTAWEVYNGEREIKCNPEMYTHLQDACRGMITRVTATAEREKALRVFEQNILTSSYQRIEKGKRKQGMFLRYMNDMMGIVTGIARK